MKASILLVFLLGVFLPLFTVSSAPVFINTIWHGIDTLAESASTQAILGSNEVLEDTRISEQSMPARVSRGFVVGTTQSDQLPIHPPQARRDYASDLHSIPQVEEPTRRQTAAAKESSPAVSSEPFDGELATEVQTEESEETESSDLQLSIGFGGHVADNSASASASAPAEAPISVSIQVGADHAGGDSRPSPSLFADDAASGGSQPTPEPDGTTPDLDTANEYIETLSASLELLKALHAFSFLAHIAHATHALATRRARKSSLTHDPQNDLESVSEVKAKPDDDQIET